MPHPDDLTTDRLAALLPVDAQGRPSIGGVSLLRKLGAGGMGAVYLGLQESLGREVAVKILPFNLAEQDARLVKRFHSEAKLAATIDSPHIVRVFDVGHEYETHYYVMEYVAGESAGALLKRGRAAGRRGIPEAEALRIVAAASKGLAAAHAAGVIHRDVKPDNILIPKGDLDAAKLADLGLAKPEGNVSTFGTLSNVAMGTPGYMAPEQAEDAKSAGPAADVFAMGATLYALLTGDAPFHGSSLVAILRAAENGDYRELPATLSAGVRWLVERCLQRDPASRFKDGAALLAAVEKVRANPAVAGPRPAPTGSASIEVASLPGVRKGPPWAIFAGAAAVVLVAVAVALAMRGRGAKEPGPSAAGDVAKPAADLPDLADKARLEAEAAATKAEAERADRFRKSLGALDTARQAAEVEDTTVAWEKAVAAGDEAMHHADGPEEEARVGKLRTAARARRGLAAAKEWAAKNPLDLRGALALAEEARKIDPEMADIPAYIRWLSEHIKIVEGIDDRRREYKEAVALAERETDPAKAADLWDAAAAKAPVDFQRDAALARARELRDGAASAQTEQRLAEARAAAEKAIASGDFEAAERELAAADRLRAGDEATASLRIRLGEARSAKAYDAAMADAETAEKSGDLAAAAAAVGRALEARPRDQRALAKAAELKDRMFSIRPVVNGGRVELELAPGVRLEFVALKPAVFTMGDGKNERRVTLTKGFAIQTTEVTQAQWKSLMTVIQCAFQGDQRPVEQVNWWEVQEFVDRLNDRLVGWTAALPSSAQWEYACRAGTKGPWGCGATAETLGEHAWYEANSDGHTHEVAKLKPNPWGLYDMHGNVWEMVWDWFWVDTYAPEAADPAGPGGGAQKVVRGGAWSRNVNDTRLSFPGCMAPEQQLNHVGFRLVLVQGEEGPPHVRRTTVSLGEKKVPMEFAQIKAGWFNQGLPDGRTDEQIHKVTFARDYWIATTEATQAQWEALMGERNFAVEGPDLPAIGVSWDETQDFLKKLAARVKPRIPSLPTESEWEFACRADSSLFAWPYGHGAEATRVLGWTSLNAKSLQPVRRLRANLWGLYDMTGNALEWCQDWYAPYTTDSLTDPPGPKSGTERVFRGGSWADPPERARSGLRDKAEPSRKRNDIGFRAALRDR